MTIYKDYKKTPKTPRL